MVQVNGAAAHPNGDSASVADDQRIDASDESVCKFLEQRKKQRNFAEDSQALMLALQQLQTPVSKLEASRVESTSIDNKRFSTTTAIRKDLSSAPGAGIVDDRKSLPALSGKIVSEQSASTARTGEDLLSAKSNSLTPRTMQSSSFRLDGMARQRQSDLLASSASASDKAPGGQLNDIKQQDPRQSVSLEAALISKQDLASSSASHNQVHEKAPPQPAMPNAAQMNLAESSGESGLLYNFRSWGQQHAVRILPATISPGQTQATSSVLALQPTSTLVEHRLIAHANLDDIGGSWHVQKNDDALQERHDQRSHGERYEHDDHDEHDAKHQHDGEDA